MKRKHRRNKKTIYSQDKSFVRFLQDKAEQCHQTAAEVIFERKLKEIGYGYETQYAFSIGNIGGIADFYLPDYKLVIEIDGG